MPSPPELSLDCKPHSYSMLLKSFVSDHHQVAITNNNNHTHQDHQQQHHSSSQNQQLEDLLSCLEAERLKIDAFKRELPLCMQLLTNGKLLNILILLIRVFLVKYYICFLVLSCVLLSISSFSSLES